MHAILGSVYLSTRTAVISTECVCIVKNTQSRAVITTTLNSTGAIATGMSAFQWVERAWGRHFSLPVAGLVPAPHFDEQLSSLLRKLLLEQQLCAVWARCPTTSHGAGIQFPTQSGPPPLLDAVWKEHTLGE